MSGPNPPFYVFDDSDIAIFSSVILAVTLAWQLLLLGADVHYRDGERLGAIRYDAISAFLSISVGISTIVGWPQSQNVASMMVLIMAQASSIGWLDIIRRVAVVHDEGVSREDIIPKAFDVVAVFLTAFLVWNSSFTYDWFASHDPKRLVYVAMSLEAASTIVGIIVSILHLGELQGILAAIIFLASMVGLVFSIFRVISMYFLYWLAMAFGMICVAVGGVSTILPYCSGRTRKHKRDESELQQLQSNETEA